ncbi:MAG TPA: hypothetical protein VN260_07470, partial [Dissulfurispiraceae bacterium]|nr:hypothetical protein [Dissulfurispiraceae bacterium]
KYVQSLPDIEAFIKYRIPVAPVTDSIVVTDYKRFSDRRRRKDEKAPVGRRQERSRKPGTGPSVKRGDRRRSSEGGGEQPKAGQ